MKAFSNDQFTDVSKICFLFHLFSFGRRLSRTRDSDEENDLDDEDSVANAVGCLGPFSGLLAPELQKYQKQIKGKCNFSSLSSHICVSLIHLQVNWNYESCSLNCMQRPLWIFCNLLYNLWILCLLNWMLVCVQYMMVWNKDFSHDYYPKYSNNPKTKLNRSC